ncbi:GNAT family N-acetyltransferase [Actinokineospora enzanensis]|uniref:GNAT family N-acetyltransferase n=1 Tax=Actinokineospora enzanensis TaxID=155975 RepID=UPI00038035A6|nr:GNAT family N-acetyltransferase [Actinokineospora enzanensis]
MSEREPVSVRPVPTEEHRRSVDLFRLATHGPPTGDEEWSVLAGTIDPDGTLGAYTGGELVGTCHSTPNHVHVPGGRLPARAVGRMAVHPTHTRRGVATELLGDLLRSVVEPVVILRSSADTLYRRLGFGIATWCRDIEVDSPQATANAAGRVRISELETDAESVPELYRRMRTRPGMVDRPDHLAALYRLTARSDPRLLLAVHSGASSEDAFALYSVQAQADRTVLDVADLHSASAPGWAGLTRYLLAVPLVDQVILRARPLDEPIRWLCPDLRACRTDRVRPELWLRLVDVPAALAIRGYHGENPVVIDVRDPLLPANSGHYLISRAGACRTTEPAHLTMAVDTLAALYLGGARPSALAATGHITVHRDVLATADRLFATETTPWCGTYI